MNATSWNFVVLVGAGLALLYFAWQYVQHLLARASGRWYIRQVYGHGAGPKPRILRWWERRHL
jgi:hypothetical protein